MGIACLRSGRASETVASLGMRTMRTERGASVDVVVAVVVEDAASVLFWAEVLQVLMRSL